jgi:hypothetical protein
VCKSWRELAVAPALWLKVNTHPEDEEKNSTYLKNIEVEVETRIYLGLFLVEEYPYFITYYYICKIKKIQYTWLELFYVVMNISKEY